MAILNQLHNEDKKRFKDRYAGIYTNMRPQDKIIFVMLSMGKKINKKFYDYFDDYAHSVFPLAFEH